ncbi:MAG: hypothetical protein ACREMF_05660 [Gemmatimonadales bacterium]
MIHAQRGKRSAVYQRAVEEDIMMNITKVSHFGIPAVLGIGIAAAAVLGRGPAQHEATIPAGTTLVGVLQNEVSTDRAQIGDAVELRTVQPLRLGERSEIPAGILIRGTVTDVKGGGRLTGAPELGIRFTALEIDDDAHAISTEQYRFGTIVARAPRSDQIVLPAGRRLTIRLRRPVTVEQPPSPVPIRAAE